MNLAQLARTELDPRLKPLALDGVNPALPGISRCAAAGEATRAAYFGDYPLLLPMKLEASPPSGAVSCPCSPS